MKNIIHHKTLREQVADAIRKKILYHELEPGMRITESELAEKFGVSHGPVREALRQLEQEGLVVYTRNVGCSVRDISFQNVVEALLIRGSYELTAARACRGNISDKAFHEMADILESMKNMEMQETPEVKNILSSEETLPETVQEEKQDFDFNLEDTILAAASAQGIEIPKDPEADMTMDDLDAELNTFRELKKRETAV